jgi:hypothetical protein
MYVVVARYGWKLRVFGVFETLGQAEQWRDDRKRELWRHTKWELEITPLLRKSPVTLEELDEAHSYDDK